MARELVSTYSDPVYPWRIQTAFNINYFCELEFNVSNTNLWYCSQVAPYIDPFEGLLTSAFSIGSGSGYSAIITLVFSESGLVVIENNVVNRAFPGSLNLESTPITFIQTANGGGGTQTLSIYRTLPGEWADFVNCGERA